MNYEAVNLGFLVSFLELFEASEKPVITAHFSPDDDSIASVLSLYEILSGLYPDKNTRIIYTGSAGGRHKIFKNYEKIEFVEDIADHLSGADLLIMLDGSKFFRFSYKSEALANVPKTICIDHHASPADNFTLSLVDSKATSVAEIIYKTFESKFTLTPDLAKIFLLGILGDTGNLSFIRPDQTEVFLIVKKLVDSAVVGIDEFKSTYSTMSKRVCILIQELIKNTDYKEIAGWPSVQYAFVDNDFIKSGSFSDEEVSASSHIYMANYLRTVEGYGWGFVITPREKGECRISARSLPSSVNVRVLFERVGLGGGHDRASGGAFKKEGEELIFAKDALAKMLDWLSKNPEIK